jgi:uncharacterized protein (TIGR04255 family)
MTEQQLRQKYPSPPIEEALVEFRVDSNKEWDPTIPGKLHERIKTSYPGKPREQRARQTSFREVEGGPAQVFVHDAVARVHLINDTGSESVSVGPNVLSVHQLKPYKGWTAFKPRVLEALHAYLEVTENPLISRVGVRYINKIVINEETVNIGEYFHYVPAVPEGLPAQVGGFSNRAEHFYSDGARLVVRFESLSDPSATPVFVLDLDLIWEPSSPMPKGEALARVEELHSREGTAFEALVTDKARNIFNAK